MKTYLVTFRFPAGHELPVTVSATDREDAQDAAIEKLEGEGYCVPDIASIKLI